MGVAKHQGDLGGPALKSVPPQVPSYNCHLRSDIVRQATSAHHALHRDCNVGHDRWVTKDCCELDCPKRRGKPVARTNRCDPAAIGGIDQKNLSVGSRAAHLHTEASGDVSVFADHLGNLHRGNAIKRLLVIEFEHLGTP